MPELWASIVRRVRWWSKPRAGEFSARYVVNARAVQRSGGADAGDDPGMILIPFRGSITIWRRRGSGGCGTDLSGAGSAVSILGVHFTRRIHGNVDAGPEMRGWAFRREGSGSGILIWRDDGK